MSKNYSLIERKLASFFRKYPFIKKKLKFKYQYLNYLLYKSKKTIISDHNIKLLSYKQGYETFFGYYDKSPLNYSEDKILFQATKLSTTELPNPNYPVKVVIKHMVDDVIIYEDETRAYNWQQGAKSMWLDNDTIIYNFYDQSDNKYKSKSYNVVEERLKVYDFPIYDCYKDYALTLNFGTLNTLRPDYGYQEIDERFLNLKEDSDGVFKIDFLNNSIEILISIKKLKTIQPVNSMLNAKHKVNHLMISPCGDRFIFLHRWFKNDRKFDRLIYYDFNTKKNEILLGDDMVSHCFWKNTENIVCFANTENHGDRYYSINVLSKKITVLPFEGSNTLGDGHPNIFNGEKMIIDTYPDRSRMKALYLIDNKEEVRRIASFFESFKFRDQTRCDLHPRWSPKGNFIFVDSVHENKKRGLYQIKLSNV